MTRRQENINGLDGLRAIAVTLVFLSHLTIALQALSNERWFRAFPRAGFLGVNMFFVLSGFLIMYRLLGAPNPNGTLRLRQFYISRTVRILPAVIVFLVAHFIYAIIFDFPPYGRVGDEIIMFFSTIFQFANYAILSNLELLDDNGALWSLSVEGHFYIVWPLVTYVLFRVLKRPAVSVSLLAALVLGLYLWQERVFVNEGYFSAYLRTDSRIASITIGALGAAIWMKTTWIAPQMLKLLSLPAVACMVFLYAHADGWNKFTWSGGMALFDLCMLIVVLALATKTFPATEVLTNAPIEWVGKISYGLYIWQIPVLTLLHRHGDSLGDWNQLYLAIIFTVALGAGSYYLVEQPTRRRVLSALAR
jgi:peptidoglycan/LPS O-acetylase OafA/YrhL